MRMGALSAGLGCYVNQNVNQCNEPPPIDAGGIGIGIHYNLGLLPTIVGTAPAVLDNVLLTVDNDSQTYVCQVSTASGTCLWPMFINYSGTGKMPLTEAPTDMTRVEVQVSSGLAAESWQFCILSLAFVPSRSGGIGDPCLTNDDCTSVTSCTEKGTGVVGWCTASCTSASDCPGSYANAYNAQSTTNYCEQSSCAPGCPIGTECNAFSLAFAQSVSCEVDGSGNSYCLSPSSVLPSPPRPAGGIGDPCLSGVSILYPNPARPKALRQYGT
jgi:hypothetical protein